MALINSNEIKKDTAAVDLVSADEIKNEIFQ